MRNRGKVKCEYLRQDALPDTPAADRFSQCGYDAAFMFISAYLPSQFSKFNINLFVDWLEPSYGIPGIGEEILARRKDMKGQRLGAHIENYAVAIEVWLNKNGVSGKTVTKYSTGTWQEIKDALDAGSPVLFASQITKSGHFILIVGYNEETKEWIVNDPAGNFFKGYFGKDSSGEGVRYSFEWLAKRAWSGVPTFVTFKREE